MNAATDLPPVDTPSSTSDAAALALDVAAIANEVGRPDLAGRLERAVSSDAPRDILVVGEYKAGKSSVVNAILNVTVCPTDVDEATAVPLIVGAGPRPVAHGCVSGPDGEIEPHPIAMGELAAALANPSEFAHGPLVSVHVRLPRRLLDGGVRLVDTPGVGGLDSPTAAVVLNVASSAAAVVFVLDGTRELTATELGVLRQLANACPAVVVAMTKIDLTPHWRTLAAATARRLTDAGLGDVAVVPVSATLRHHGLDRDDTALNDRSGYPRLVTRLRHAIGPASTDGALAAATSVVLRRLDQWCRDERAALAEADADVRAGRLRDVVEARARVAELRSTSAGWSQTLADQGAALAADADHDLRTRVRALTQDIDDAVDLVDPGDGWDVLAHDLRRRITEQVIAHREAVQRRAEAAVTAVAHHFLDQRAAAAPRFDDAVGDPLPNLAGPQAATMRIGGGALVAMKGSYGGVLMFGFASGLVGLSMVNPITAVAGVALGRKALADERKRQLTLRRAQASATLRKALDEVVHVESKRSRDAVRQLQQELRHEFGIIATELARAVDASLQDAQAALAADDDARTTRMSLLDAAQRELSSLRGRTAALARSEHR